MVVAARYRHRNGSLCVAECVLPHFDAGVGSFGRRGGGSRRRHTVVGNNRWKYRVATDCTHARLPDQRHADDRAARRGGDGQRRFPAGLACAAQHQKRSDHRRSFAKPSRDADCSDLVVWTIADIHRIYVEHLRGLDCGEFVQASTTGPQQVQSMYWLSIHTACVSRVRSVDDRLECPLSTDGDTCRCWYACAGVPGLRIDVPKKRASP